MDFALTVKAEPTQLTVMPGATGRLAVTVKNISQEVQHLTVAVRGLPSKEFWRVTPEELQLEPDQQGEYEVVLTVPQDGSLAGGVYNLGLLAYAQYDQSIRRATEFALTVPAVSEIAFDVQPKIVTSRTKAVYRLTVANAGNTTAAVAFSALDDQGKARFSFNPPVAQVPRGVPFQATMTAKAPARWSGRDVPRNLVVRAQAGSAAAEEQRVTFTQRPLLASGLMRGIGVTLGIAVMAGAIIAGAVLGNNNDDDNAAADTPPSVAPTTALPTTAGPGGTPAATATSSGPGAPTLTSLSIDPAVAVAGSPVSFAAETSDNTETWLWAVEPETATDPVTIATPTEPATTITFPAGGTYSVKLKIASADGSSFDYAQTLLVGAPPALFQFLSKPLVLGPNATVPDATPCPPDRHVISGGVDVEIPEGQDHATTVIGTMLPVTSEDDSVGSWSAVVFNPAASNSPVTIKAGCVTKARLPEAPVLDGTPVPMAAASNAIATANCPAGQVVLNGGGGVISEAGGETQIHLLESRPVQVGGAWTQWRVIARNDGSEDLNLTAVVVCAQQPASYSVEVAEESPAAVEAGTEYSGTAMCGDGSVENMLSIGGGIGFADDIDPTAVGGAIRESTSNREIADDGNDLTVDPVVPVWTAAMRVDTPSAVNVWVVCAVLRTS